MLIIAGSSNKSLAENIVKSLQGRGENTELLACNIDKHANGEKKIKILDEDKVRGKKVCILQSFSDPVDENIIETLLIADALERIGARSASIIIPWMGYSLQDKVFTPGEPISAKVVANVISNSFIKRVFLLDLHNSSIPGFFSIPTDHFFADQLFIEYLKKNQLLNNSVVVSPDFGGIKRARTFAKKVNLPLLNIDKNRDLSTGEVTANAIHGGSVVGKNVLLFDDVIVSGGTVIETAKLLKENGAEKIIFYATHGIFCNNALEKIEKSDLDKVVVTNSIEQKTESKKLEILNLSEIFAQELLNWK